MNRESWYGLMLSAAVLTGTPRDATAQTPGALKGRVVDPAGQPLSYANVQFNGGKRVLSDDSGRFSAVVPGAGSVRLIVRRIGFSPEEITLATIPDTALRIVLRPIAQELKEVTITAGNSAFPSLDIQGFYRRMKDADRGINHGYFVTPEDLALRKPPYISQMADGYPSIRVRRGWRPWDDVITGPLGCKMTVYLDRIRIVGRLNGVDDKVNEMAPPNHVAGMEIYPRSVSAPPEFQALNGTCGVVLIWTK